MDITLVTALNPRDVVEALRIAAKYLDTEGGQIAKDYGGTSEFADEMVRIKVQMAIDARATAAHLESEVISKENHG